MTHVYAGLDIFDKSTHICAVDGEGTIVWREVRNYGDSAGITVTVHSIP